MISAVIEGLGCGMMNSGATRKSKTTKMDI